MQNGKWVPISKYFADSLPRNRKFTELEAMYSLQLDYDKSNSITVSGCASRWGWSRSTVSKFFVSNEITINYDKNTKNYKKQRGYIDVHPDKKRALNEQENSNNGALKEHKRFIDSSWIGDKKSIKRTIKEHKKSINGSTTIDPNPNPEPNPKDNIQQNEFADQSQDEIYMTKKSRKLSGKRLSSFLRFWDIFNYKKDKANAADSWYDIPQLTDSLVDEICISAKKEYLARPDKFKNGQTPIYAQGWLSAKRWEDETTTGSQEQTRPRRSTLVN